MLAFNFLQSGRSWDDRSVLLKLHLQKIFALLQICASNLVNQPNRNQAGGWIINKRRRELSIAEKNPKLGAPLSAANRCSVNKAGLGLFFLQKSSKQVCRNAAAVCHSASGSIPTLNPFAALALPYCQDGRVATSSASRERKQNARFTRLIQFNRQANHHQ